MLLVAVRALILYILLVIVMRLMGKRQIGQLQPFELVIAIVLAELAVIPMSDTGIPLTNGIIGILVLLAAEIFLSLLSLHSEKARGIICGTPTILVYNGKPVPEAMRRVRLNMNDLLEQLRNKEYPNISDVAYAILETNGSLSVIPKSPGDQAVDNTQTQPVLPVTLIVDGKVNLKNLKFAKISMEQLIQQARNQQINDLRDVFFAQLTTKGQFDFYPKENAGDTLKQKWLGYLSVLVIIGIIITSGILLQNYLDKSANSMITALQIIKDELEQEQWPEGKNKFNSFTKQWEQVRKNWALFIDHLEIHNLEMKLARIEELLDMQEKKEILPELNEIIVLLQHIPERERLTWRNIL